MASLDDLVSNVKNGVLNIGNLTKAIQAVFPNITGQSTTATAGTASALPATPAGYFTMNNPQTGQVVKVAFYNE